MTLSRFPRSPYRRPLRCTANTLRRLGLISVVGSTAVAEEPHWAIIAVAHPSLQPGEAVEPREAVVAVVDPPLQPDLRQGFLSGLLRRLCVGRLNRRLDPRSREQFSNVFFFWIKTYCLGLLLGAGVANLSMVVGPSLVVGLSLVVGVSLVVGLSLVVGARVRHRELRKTCLR
jgi:hypothetical protein